jgi:hypothetical protein
MFNPPNYSRFKMLQNALVSNATLDVFFGQTKLLEL